MRRLDLTGMRFGRLLVMSMSMTMHNGRSYCQCLCDCGATKFLSATEIKANRLRSCGCLIVEHAKALNLRHGEARGKPSAEYIAWRSMVQRCTDPGSQQYERYGARGIVVCERWAVFEHFLADMGRRPSDRHSLDRYPDNNGNYEPKNCRWATLAQQSRNRRNNLQITYQGRPQTLANWCEQLSLDYRLTVNRLGRGWTPERAFTTPRRPFHNRWGQQQEAT